MRRIATCLLVLPSISATAPTASVEFNLTGLRNSRGAIQACMTRSPLHFPDCQEDPLALRRTVPANVRQLRFDDLPAGTYALSVIHDSNANRKLDTLVGIPREGFGFSRNPRIGFGPPRFDKVSMQLGPGFTRAYVRMQYLL